MFAPTQVAPPRPHQNPSNRWLHGQLRADEFSWMHDPAKSARLRRVLRSENAHADAMLNTSAPIISKIAREIRGRADKNHAEEGEPVWFGDYQYAVRRPRGRRENQLYRRAEGATRWQFVFDPHEWSAGDPGFSMPVDDLRELLPNISPCQTMLVAPLDWYGHEQTTFILVDIKSGILLDQWTGAGGMVAWSEDSSYVFYSEPDMTCNAVPARVRRRSVGAAELSDVVVVGRANNNSWVDMHQAHRWLLVERVVDGSIEHFALDMRNPTTRRRLIRRDTGDQYTQIVARASGTDWGTFVGLESSAARPTGRIVERSANPSRRAWHERLAPRISVELDSIIAVGATVAIVERIDGRARVSLLPDGASRVRPAPSPLTATLLGCQHRVPAGYDGRYSEATEVRVEFRSYTCPAVECDIDQVTAKPIIKVRIPARTRLAEERRWVRAADGANIPVTLVYRSDIVFDGARPVLLEGYGAYGTPEDPAYYSTVLPLLERGFVFAVAHVRGGGGRGGSWHASGMAEQRETSVSDFIRVAEYMIKSGISAPGRIAAQGSSAGGTLIGAAVNARPELFGAMVLLSPAMDPLGAQLTPTSVLSRTSRYEWGDPRASIDAFRVLTATSPYDGVHAANYPPAYVRVAWFDQRTPAWEASKWANRVRRLSTSANPVIIRVGFTGRHAGPWLRDTWFDLTAECRGFVVSALDAPVQPLPYAGRRR